MTPSQIALSWLLKKQVVTSPIIGTTNVSHLEEMIESINVKISDEEMKFLEEPYIPQSITGFT